MREILKALGFNYSAACHCNGVYTEKYRNGIWDVWVRPKSYKFVIRKDGSMITKWAACGSDCGLMTAAIEQNVPKAQP